MRNDQRPWIPKRRRTISQLKKLAHQPLTANVVSDQPVGIELMVDFEIEGEEMVVNNFPDIDFDGFNIRISFNMEYDTGTGLRGKGLIPVLLVLR